MVKICIVTFTVLASSHAISHSGGTDSSGCHAGSKPYHCHGGGSSGSGTNTPNTGRDTYTPDTVHSSDTLHRHCAYGKNYSIGISLAATVGFGLGHAIQCRWLHGGWIFTLSQLAATTAWVSADDERVLRITKYIFFLSKFLEFLSAMMPPKQVG